MNLPHTVAQVLRDHVTLEVESIDRMYLNVYMSDLQREQGVVWFLRHHRGHLLAPSALMDPISRAFIAGIEDFMQKNVVPMVSFAAWSPGWPKNVIFQVAAEGRGSKWSPLREV